MLLFTIYLNLEKPGLNSQITFQLTWIELKEMEVHSD